MVIIAGTVCAEGNESETGIILRNALLDCGGSGFNDGDVVKNEYGKPYIPCSSAPYFSVSHSHRFVCAASTVGDITLATDHMKHIETDHEYNIVAGQNLFLKLYRSGNLGVDVEYIDEKMDMMRMERIARRKFFEGEMEYIFASSCEISVRDRFFRVWTRKESYGKYVGKGLTAGLAFDTSVCSGEFLTSYFAFENKKYLLTLYAPHPDPERI